MRTHPITGMTLEDGIGRLPDHQQALVLHLPYIELTRGEAIAAEMRDKIMALINPPKPRENLRAASLPPVEAPKPALTVVTDGKPVQ